MSKQSIKSLTRKGYSQQKIAKTLHIRKEKVVAFQRRAKIGVRRPSEFFGRVKAIQLDQESTWEEARKAIFNMPRWARKRAARQGKQYKSYKDFWKEWKKKWKDATQEEKDKHGYEATYGEEGEYVGGTPH